MAWYINFIPAECDSISVSINNIHWTTWTSANGNVTWILADQWKDLDRIKVSGSVSPEDRNGRMNVLWDGEVRQEFDFDDEEEHDVERP